MLTNGIWALVTAKSTASKALSKAYQWQSRPSRDCLRETLAVLQPSVQWVARQLQQAPFAVPLRFMVTGVQRMQESNVVTYGFDTLVDARCPLEIGQEIRARWPEVLAWRGKIKSGNGHNNGSPPATKLIYTDQTQVDPANPREVAAFTQYKNAHLRVPASRSVLKTWVSQAQ